MIDLARIKEHSDRLSALECDGMTKVISYLLAQAGVAHQAVAGTLSIVTPEGQPVYFPSDHCWVEVEGQIIDYRVRMWLPGDLHSIAPDGLFSPADYPGFTYSAQGVLDPVSQQIYGILCMTGTPLPPETLLKLMGGGGEPSA